MLHSKYSKYQDYSEQLAVALNTQDLDMPNKVDSKYDVILKGHHVRNYEEFSRIDKSFQCDNKNLTL
jgi:hypothetical protein